MAITYMEHFTYQIWNGMRPTDPFFSRSDIETIARNTAHLSPGKLDSTVIETRTRQPDRVATVTARKLRDYLRD